MTRKTISLFQKIANEKGWTFKQIGERWGVSERQMSRIANAGNQRDLDSVNGLPDVNSTMKYEEVVHDQALFSATEGLALYRQLASLSRKKDDKKRRCEAKHLDKRFSNHASRCMTLGYMYKSVGRFDLQDLIEGLVAIMLNDGLIAFQNPESWKEACDFAGTSTDIEVNVPEEHFRKWRLNFLEAIKK